MTVKPIKEFRAVISGSAYPQSFSENDELSPDSEAAQIALNLGLLTKEDANKVRDYREAMERGLKTDSEQSAPQKKKQGAAPENKAGGAKE